MSLRTPNTLTSRQTLLDLQRTKERISILQDQIASGNRIVRLSSDPSGAALILDFQTSIDRNTAYLRQVDTAGSFLSAAETMLTAISSHMMRLGELGTQGLVGQVGASGRIAIGQEVDGIRSALLSLANSQDQGKFLFAGSTTLTQPFSGPPAGPITYAGNSGIINMDVSNVFTVPTNIPGNTAFFGPGGQGSATDLFQAVTDLRDALLANNTAQIQTAHDNLLGIHSRIIQHITDLGGRQSSLNQLRETLGAINLNLETVLDNTQGLNYPEAVAEFSNEQTIQQATLQTMAKVSRQNLFDFLA
jgi:flagellar hook-associated protein 3 FlgL